MTLFDNIFSVITRKYFSEFWHHDALILHHSRFTGNDISILVKAMPPLRCLKQLYFLFERY